MSVPKQSIEHRFTALLVDGCPIYDKAWLDRAAALAVDLAEFRIAAVRMHRRAQQAERLAFREGQRADRLAGKVRRLLTRGAHRENC
jgi:hypothetical protein